MLDYINIVAKEDIKVVPSWILFTLLGCLMAIVVIPTIISWLIVSKKKYKWANVVYTELIAGGTALVFAILSSSLLLPRCAVASGKYNYKVTIDKNTVTVAEYEEFLRKYNPDIKGDYYYFEYGELEN